MDLKEAKARAYDCMTQIEFWRQELAKANQLVNKIFAEQAEVKQTAEKLDRARGKADAMENKTKTN